MLDYSASLMSYKHLGDFVENVTGAELALQAADLAETDLDEIRMLLRVRVIPHVIDSIWTHGETLGTPKLRTKPLTTTAIEELARIVVTFPPSTALTAMHQILDSQGISPQLASGFLKEFAVLSRSPLSTLNYFRHIKTSINVYLRALCIGWDEEKMQSSRSMIALREIKTRVNPFIILNKDAADDLAQISAKLGLRKISQSSDLDQWLDEMALFLNHSMQEDRKSRPSIQERANEKLKTWGTSSTNHTVTLYSGRFTHYIYRAAIQSLGYMHSPRYKESLDLQNKAKFDFLNSLVIKSPKATFEYLNTLAAHKPARINQAGSNFAVQSRNDLIQKFDLGGRELIIEKEGVGLESALVENLLSNLSIQFDLKLYSDNLYGEVENSQGFIKISLAKPQKKDFEQIQKILRALIS
jgi:hypothetical protein